MAVKALIKGDGTLNEVDVKLQNLSDLNVSLGAGVDEYALCYDHDTTKFVLRAVAVGTFLKSDGSVTGATSQAQPFTFGIQTGIIFPASDSVAAVQIRKANGSTNVLNVDTSNGRVGVGNAAPTVALDVTGAALFSKATTHDVLKVVGTYNYRLFSVWGAADTQPRFYYISAGFWMGSGSATVDTWMGRANVGVIGVDGNSAIGHLAATGYLGAGITLTNSPTTPLDGNINDAVTDAITNVLTIRHASSGTPAAGFGASIIFGLESTTTENQSAARIQAVWTEATHASRKAALILTAYDTAEREGLRIGANGSAPTIGLYGVTPVARATTSGSAAAFVQGSGNAVNDASTFGGYTLAQIAKALQDIGVLT